MAVLRLNNQNPSAENSTGRVDLIVFPAARLVESSGVWFLCEASMKKYKTRQRIHTDAHCNRHVDIGLMLETLDAGLPNWIQNGTTWMLSSFDQQQEY